MSNLDGFMEVDYDEETIKEESQEINWAEGATVMICLSDFTYKPYNDKRRPGAKAVGVTFKVSVMDPETGATELPSPMTVFTALPLKSPDTPDLQAPDFARGAGSTWASICAGFVEDYHTITWDKGNAFVNGVALDRAEIDGVKEELGAQRVKLAKKLYNSQFDEILKNVCYATIKFDNGWAKPSNLRDELKPGEELTPKEELRVRSGSKKTTATASPSKKKKK